MARKLPRKQRAAYRRDDVLMARIREATTWRTRLNAGVDYLKAALADMTPEVADQVAEEASLALADTARRLTFGDDQ